MKSFGNITGFGLKGKESVNAPFSIEQLTIKSELLAIAEASQSDILAKLQQTAPNILKDLTATQQEQDLQAAAEAADAAREENPVREVIPIMAARSYDGPENPTVDATRARVEKAFLDAAA